MFPTKFRHHTLSFVGICIPFTMGANGLSEMQARYITKVIKGEVKLPSLTDMQQEVITRKDLNYKQFSDHTPFLVSLSVIFKLPSFTNMEVLTEGYNQKELELQTI